MQKKERINIIVHPDKVMIKVTQSEWNNLFSIWIRRADGSQIQLFTDITADEGYEQRFKQNVSVGTIVAVGTNLKGILKGDVAIIDYLVTGQDDALVGYVNGNRMVAIPAVTIYHAEDSPPYIDGRRAWVVGDIDVLSPLLGVVRMGKIIASRPYVFLKWENNRKMNVSEEGAIYETIDEICVREVIAAHPESGYKDGDKVILKESDLFTRTIDGKELSVIMEDDIIGVK